MHTIFSIIAAAGSLALPQTAVATNPPIAVSSCTVSDIYGDAAAVDFGPPISFRVLQLRFLNTDDTVATQVTFDVTHGGTHTTVIDRGRFSKNVTIEHRFDQDFAAGYDRGPDVCAVAAVTFADGRRWAAPGNVTPKTEAAR